MSDSLPAAPRPPRRPTHTEHHGDHREDPYAWLGQVEDPQVLAHLVAENSYTDAMTGPAARLAGTVFDEIVARTRLTDVSVPYRHGRHWYYARTSEGQDHPRYCRCPVAGPDDWEPPEADDGELPGEEVILDAQAESAGHPFFSLGAFTVDDSGDLLAFSVDTSGDERHTLRVRDLVTGADLDDRIEGLFYGAVWSSDGSSLFYVEVDDAWRPYRVRRHDLGTDPATDPVVLTEPDERFWVGVDRSTSGRRLLICSASKTSTEFRLLPLDDPRATPELVRPRTAGLEYDVDHVNLGGREHLLVVHNGDGPDFALALADPHTPDVWRTVLAHESGRRVQDATVAAGTLVAGIRRDGLSRVLVLPDPDDLAQAWEVPFDEPLFDAGLGTVAEPDCPYLQIGYTSYCTPATVYDLEPGGRRLIRRKQQQVLGGYDPAGYVQRREWAVAGDGTRIPISVVARRDVPADGTAPLLVYGYGSYEASMDPAFTIPRLSLLERGVVFAVAHVRGGGELGRAWYDDGKLGHKPNSFTDFVACTRRLVELGWGAPDRVAAMGGSAGGLLVGAVANLAPELYTAVLAEVPFVDPLTTMLDPSLPLTVLEREEWGDPLEDPQAYEWIKSYSPYEQVRPGVRYPAILATTSQNDTRVRFVEPAKWIARLRELAPDGGPYLLRTTMDAGHGGASGRYEAWRERAFEFAWLLTRLDAATPDG